MKYKNLYVNLIAALVIFSSFKIENSYDKYIKLESIKATENWVKSNQGTRVSFNFTFAKNEQGAVDRFLVIQIGNGFTLNPFVCGDHLILTINESEKIYLKLSCLGSYGEHSSFRPATFETACYLEPPMFQKITHANSIYFELQGIERDELTGYFKPENLNNLRSIAQR